MEIQVEALKRCHLVTVAGQVDSARAPELEAELLGALDGGARNLVVNLREVRFISSAGLSALIRAQIRASKKIPAGSVALSEVPTRLRETFELTGLHHVFRFYDRDVEAIGSL